MTKIVPLKCPICGANISHETLKCEYCGTSIVIAEELRESFEGRGYDLSTLKGYNRIMREMDEKRRKEEERERALFRSIFPTIEKVFNDCVKELRKHKKWQKAKLVENVEETSAEIVIWTRVSHTLLSEGWIDLIRVELSPYAITIKREVPKNCIKYLPTQLLNKYKCEEVHDYDIACITKITVDDFTEEKLAQVLSDFFIP